MSFSIVPAVLATSMLLGACSKSEPETSSQAAPSGSASPTSAGAAASAPSEVPKPSEAAAAADEHGDHMKSGMPPGMPMQHRHDGGMEHPMGDHPPEHR